MVRALLYLWLGHICCICGFEWSRMWAFFPGRFRVAATIFLTLALAAGLLLDQVKKEERGATVVLGIMWAGTVLSPLLTPLWAVTVMALGGVVLLLGLISLSRSMVGILGLALVCSLEYFNLLPMVATGCLLVVVGSLEWWSLQRNEPELAPLPKPEDGPPRAEIYWLGFAQLYACSARGEGEKFSSQVLRDTSGMIESCGGRLTKGSEHRGIYCFHSVEERDRCFHLMDAYGKQMGDVLEKADAPSVSLVFKNEN